MDKKTARRNLLAAGVCLLVVFLSGLASLVYIRIFMMLPR